MTMPVDLNPAPREPIVPAPRVFMIDNYDSFTYNLVQYLGELGAEITVLRNDKVTLDEIAEVLHEVVGERVVVVDHEHARRRDDGRARGRVEVDGRGHRENSSWASSMARSRAAALFWVSSYSLDGSLSATMPAPACTWATPSLTMTVRMQMQVSRSPP